jgi:hypothetical protein
MASTVISRVGWRSRTITGPAPDEQHDADDRNDADGVQTS